MATKIREAQAPRPASEILPGLIGERAAQALLHKKGGRPVKADKKVNQTLRLYPDEIAVYTIGQLVAHPHQSGSAGPMPKLYK